MTSSDTPAVRSLDLFNLTGRNVLISGATRGIGLACAQALLQAGASLCLLLRPSSSTAVPPLDTYHKDQCLVSIQYDLSTLTSSSANDAVAAAERQLNAPIDILINCGGIQRRAKSVDFTEDMWDEVMQVNLKSAFLLSQAAARSMIPRHRGKIINFCSLLSFQGGLTVPAYASAKGALAQLTKALSNEWAKEGIQVNGIAPGYIETDMNEALLQDPVRLRQISERIPAGRWGKPDDFAGPIVFLASDASMYVSGEILVVDGGWMGR